MTTGFCRVCGLVQPGQRETHVCEGGFVLNRLLNLCLENAHDGGLLEECDVWLDPDDPDSYEVLDRYFIAMAARAAGEEIDRSGELSRMPWLHDYTLLVRDGLNKADVFLRYRKG